MRRTMFGAWMGLLLLAAPAAAQSPRAQITDGPPPQTESATAAFSFRATAFAPLTSFECRLDGGAWTACTSPQGYSGLLGGPHEFAVRLMGPLADPAPATRAWTVIARSEVLPPVLPPPPADVPAPPKPRTEVRRDARGCAYGANRPGEVTGVRLERSVVCLVNAYRRKLGLQSVRPVGALRTAAVRHARDMVAKRYFAHASRNGRRAADRIRATGYFRARRAWAIGEVLAWGTGPLSSPVAVLDAWVKSQGHRAVLQHPSFRDIGVGLARGIPRRGRSDGATYVAEFGRR